MGKQIYKSRQNRMLAGICGGISEYFNIDVTLVRLIWVIVGFTYGMGIIAYIIAAIVIPERTDGFYQGPTDFGSQNSQSSQGGFNNQEFNIKPIDSKNTAIFFGTALILLGLLFLAKQFISWFDARLFLPLILIAIGAFIIFAGRKNQ